MTPNITAKRSTRGYSRWTCKTETVMMIETLARAKNKPSWLGENDINEEKLSPLEQLARTKDHT